MKDETVTRREFDLYVKMNAETNQNISSAIDAIKGQGQETLDVLKEYTIHNNHKHDKTNDRITSLAKKLDKVCDAMIAQQSVTQFWTTIGKYGKYSLIGGLTVLGAYLAKDWFHIK